MSLLIVGTMAFDSVETPYTRVKDVLGGSATYASIGASLFSPANIVAVVGEDFDLDQLAFLREMGVDTKGVSQEPGKTFRWSGRYHTDWNIRDTLDTQLNVFENFHPHLPESYRSASFIFLANMNPELQIEVLSQIDGHPQLIAMDTMNYWITNTSEELNKIIKMVNIIILNDEEARLLSGENNLVKAAKFLQKMGPDIVVIKKGEHGALMFERDFIFFAPAFPLEEICDTTGAGDVFAGGFMGYLAQTKDLGSNHLRRAVIYGSTMASFCVEEFSINRFKTLRESEIAARFNTFKAMINF